MGCHWHPVLFLQNLKHPIWTQNNTGCLWQPIIFPLIWENAAQPVIRATSVIKIYRSPLITHFLEFDSLTTPTDVSDLSEGEVLGVWITWLTLPINIICINVIRRVAKRNRERWHNSNFTAFASRKYSRKIRKIFTGRKSHKAVKFAAFTAFCSFSDKVMGFGVSG